jgi:DNA (cytosine-5)-methyltransferase 1
MSSTGKARAKPAPEPGKDAKVNRLGISETAFEKRTLKGMELEKLTGWPWPAEEVTHLLGTPRKFAGGLGAWREELVSRILNGDLQSDPDLAGSDLKNVRRTVDEYIGLMREIARHLALLHRTPDLGNKKEPIDELIYIILSRKTRESAYQHAYDKLKDRYSTWDDAAGAAPEEIEKLIWSSGLSGRKATSILGALNAIKEKFGSCSLDDAVDWSDLELESFLCSLPEIQKKSAYCVMMYSMGRQVFPVDTHVGRIMKRLGPTRILDIDLDGLDHKRLQSALVDLVPPVLRHSLHVNMVMHGRATCKARSPGCDGCAISRFCRQYRDEKLRAASASNSPIFMDFFCGAGGLSLGFRNAGFRPILALDSDASATRTYMYNDPTIAEADVLTGDVRDLEIEDLRRRLDGRQLDLMLGAPPCQGFSNAGKRTKLAHFARKALQGYSVDRDKRNYLFEYLIGAALQLKPTLFLMENVPGMDTKRNGGPSFMQTAALMLEQGGYATAIWKLNAVSFGVPQKRLRKFLVASLTGSVPSFPESDFQDRTSSSFDPDALPPISLDQAIFDLPPLDAEDGDVVMIDDRPENDDDPRSRFYLTNSRFQVKKSGAFIYNHRSRYQNDRDLELYALLEPGEDSVHAVERHGRSDLMRYRTDIFDDKYSKMRPTEPAKTIVSHLAKDGNSYIHPDQTRSITQREAARIQSFPDDHIFCGGPTEQWVQIGNSVPPALAHAIGQHLMDFLKRSEYEK